MGRIGKFLNLAMVMVLLVGSKIFAADSGDLQLVNAAKDKDRDAVRSLLRQGADVNSAQPDGSTALAWSAHWDDLEMANLLLAAGADVNLANDYGVTPLLMACGNGNNAMVLKFVKSGADPNTAQWAREAPIMRCTRSVGLDAIQALIASGADVNAATRRGQTALMWAAGQARLEIVQILIEHGADVNATTHLIPGFKPPQYFTWGLFDHVKGRPDRHDPNDFHLDPASSRGGYTPLMFAARVGDVESARLLIAAGADVNVEGPDGSSLLVASASGQEDVAILFLEEGADPNASDGWGITPLHWAVQEGLQAIAAARLQSPTDHLWYHENMPNMAKALLAKGADPNARISKGTAPFNYPPFSHRGGITLPQIRKKGATPFFLAAAAADMEMMQLLLSNGADPRMPTEDRATPLMVAAGLGLKRAPSGRTNEQALRAVMLTVELGNQVQAVALENRTALHGAAYMAANDIIKFLVERGADINAEDKFGQTPLSIAMGDPERLVDPFDKRFWQQPPPHKDTAALLLSLGAKPLSGNALDVGAAKRAAPSRYPLQRQDD
jgi:ankyrin repeat protein